MIRFLWQSHKGMCKKLGGREMSWVAPRTGQTNLNRKTFVPPDNPKQWESTLLCAVSSGYFEIIRLFKNEEKETWSRKAFACSPKQCSGLRLGFLPPRGTWEFGLYGSESKRPVPSSFIGLFCQHLSLNCLFLESRGRVLKNEKITIVGFTYDFNSKRWTSQVANGINQKSYVGRLQAWWGVRGLSLTIPRSACGRAMICGWEEGRWTSEDRDHVFFVPWM